MKASSTQTTEQHAARVYLHVVDADGGGVFVAYVSPDGRLRGYLQDGGEPNLDRLDADTRRVCERIIQAPLCKETHT